MCRALSSSQSAEMAVFWEQLLGGPLIPLLQNYYEDSTLSAQACDILATMSSHSMATIKVRKNNIEYVPLCFKVFTLLAGTIPHAGIEPASWSE